MSDDSLALEDDLGLAPEPAGGLPWKVLIVDDEPEVHAVTRLVLSNFRFENRPLQFVSAHSGADGMKALAEHPDIALVLLDVVMETDHAGLDVVRYCREELGNHFVRIVLRTGQPGQAPESRVTTEYDINDYKEKTELTTQKLSATVRVALRGYRDIITIERARGGLERVIGASAHIFSHRQSAEFASAVLYQLGHLVGLECGTLYCRIQQPPDLSDPDSLPQHFEIAAATGEFEKLVHAPAEETLPDKLVRSLREAWRSKQHLFRDDHYVLHFMDSRHGESLLYVGEAWNLQPHDFQLVELFCTNVSIAFENLHLNRELSDSQLEMVCLLAGAAECTSAEAARRVQRVGAIAHRLGEQLGLDDKTCEALRFATPLHDVGKLRIPAEIVNKPGPLDDAERETMRGHARLGAEMLAGSRHSMVRMAAEIAMTHHERWDGAGYPSGIAGERIPLPGRIGAIADVLEALASERCWRPAWAPADIHAHFVGERGAGFDPRLVDLLLGSWDDYLALLR